MQNGTAPITQNKTAHRLVQTSNLLSPPETGKPAVYQMPMTLDFEDPKKFLRRIIVGNPVKTETEKVVMLTGATGSGKTTLINAMTNFFYGVSWEDDFRFKLIADEGPNSQAHAQTKWITAYHLEPAEGCPVPFRIIVIDTPGFGDTGGIEEDKKTMEKVRDFFSLPNGIPHLNVVGFVVQAPLARLTPSQKFVFNNIQAIFGKDMSNSIHLMITFADGQDPPVLVAVKEANIPHQGYFRFNNSAIYARNKNLQNPIEAQFSKMFWDMGKASLEKFFNDLRRTPEVSLAMTIETLNERHRLMLAIRNIRPQIDEGLVILEQIKKDLHEIETHKAEIEKGQNWQYEVTEFTVEKISIAGTGRFTTYCGQCNYTCHEDCTIPESGQKEHCYTMFRDRKAIYDELKNNHGVTIDYETFVKGITCKRQGSCAKKGEKSYCTCWYQDSDLEYRSAMNLMFSKNLHTKNTRCSICTGKCHFDKHYNADFIKKQGTKKVMKTNDRLKEMYDRGQQGKNKVQGMIDEAKRRFDQVRNETMRHIYQVHSSLKRLDEIAHRSNPMLVTDYIDQLMETEKAEKKPGWSQRLEALHDCRKEAELVDQLKHGNLKTFEEYDEVIEKLHPNQTNVENKAGGVIGFLKKFFG